MGQQSVGSMVSFVNGKPDKNNYRRFRIKTVEGIDDVQMIAEVVRRRYTRLQKEGLRVPGFDCYRRRQRPVRGRDAGIKEIKFVAGGHCFGQKGRRNFYAQTTFAPKAVPRFAGLKAFDALKR